MTRSTRPNTPFLALAVAAAALMAAAATWRLTRPAAPPVVFLETPGAESVAGIDGTSATLISGRRVTPAGRVHLVQSYSWGMALNPDETRVALVGTSAIEFVDPSGAQPPVRLPPHGEEAPQAFGSGGYMGCAFSPDGRLLYFGSADTGEIKALDVATRQVVATIALDGNGFEDSFAGELAVNEAGTELYVLDQFNYRLAIVDLASLKVTRSVRVGRHPFGLALSPDGRHAWVSHVGMFEYPLLPGVTEGNRRTTGLAFPAYGIPSPEAEGGTTAEGVAVPGLGSPNHPDAMSLFGVDLAAGRITARVKTGYLVGALRDGLRTIGGSSPGAVAAGVGAVYVANATNDTVTVVDAAAGTVSAEIELNVPGLERLRGVLPFGLALDPAGRRLYVACAGLNAVAVIDLASRKVEGYIPAGWFCSSVALSKDGRTLFVISAKGLGSGPNGGRGFTPPARGTHPADIMQGTLQVLAVPSPEELARYTRQVLDNTSRRRPVTIPPDAPVRLDANGLGIPGPIRHVVFVVKENRTFDQVYGQRRGVKGDPTLTTLGLGMRVASKDGTRVIDRVDVSPNHHALADRFAISDNFYCDADQSNTGHRWVAGVYPNEWVEINARSKMEARLFSRAPGRRSVAGSSATVLPEDYNEAGALWEHLDRHHVSFFNFGFGTEMPASLEEQAFKETGIRMAVSFPLPKPLFDRTSRKYATFNMAIPDQYRMDVFEEELRDRWLSGREPFPRLVTLVLPNDHLTKEHPDDGYPFAESYMADNDLALGRLVQALSRTPWWKEMLVVVTEDDPQGGRDHVEAHRSLLLLAGPHVRRGYVSHALADFGSVMRLVFAVLGLPPLNQFDATAPLPLDFFDARPDPEGYTARRVDARLFDPDRAFKPFDRRFDWKELAGSVRIDDPEDMRRQYSDARGPLATVVPASAGRQGAR
jgi:YVTN family beta-propeller protein